MNREILIIDDDILNVKVLKSRLEEEKFKVVSASNGQQGLEMAKKINPSLIILDIMMPGMDGYTFVKKLKFDNDIKNIPVIILSGQEKMQDLFAMEGITDYLVKPYKPKELLEIVNKHLR